FGVSHPEHRGPPPQYSGSSTSILGVLYLNTRGPLPQYSGSLTRTIGVLHPDVRGLPPNTRGPGPEPSGSCTPMFGVPHPEHRRRPPHHAGAVTSMLGARDLNPRPPRLEYSAASSPRVGHFVADAWPLRCRCLVVRSPMLRRSLANAS